jgi:hypothetical protein
LNIGTGGRREIEDFGFFQGGGKEWVMQQSDKFKLDMLGRKRYNLLQENKIKLDDLINYKTGKLILLKDL